MECTLHTIQQCLNVNMYYALIRYRTWVKKCPNFNLSWFLHGYQVQNETWSRTPLGCCSSPFSWQPEDSACYLHTELTLRHPQNADSSASTSIQSRSCPTHGSSTKTTWVIRSCMIISKFLFLLFTIDHQQLNFVLTSLDDWISVNCNKQRIFLWYDWIGWASLAIFQSPYNPYEYGGIPIHGPPGRPTDTAASDCSYCESHWDCKCFCGISSYCQMDVKTCSHSRNFPDKPTVVVAWSGHGRHITH